MTLIRNLACLQLFLRLLQNDKETQNKDPNLRLPTMWPQLKLVNTARLGLANDQQSYVSNLPKDMHF